MNEMNFEKSTITYWFFQTILCWKMATWIWNTFDFVKFFHIIHDTRKNGTAKSKSWITWKQIWIWLIEKNSQGIVIQILWIQYLCQRRTANKNHWYKYDQTWLTYCDPLLTQLWNLIFFSKNYHSQNARRRR